MKGLLTLGLISLFGTSILAQTQMIAHRSHSGKNKNFKINGWTNLGLGYTEEDLRRMSYDRFQEQSVNIESKMSDLSQEIDLNNARTESEEKKVYGKTLQEMKTNLSDQSLLLKQISDLLETQRIMDSTAQAENQLLYAEMREKDKSGDENAVAELRTKISTRNTENFKKKNKIDKQRYSLEQKYNELSTEFNKLDFTSRTHKHNVKLLDQKVKTDIKQAEEKADIISNDAAPNTFKTELAPMTKKQEKAYNKRLKKRLKQEKKEAKKLKKADKKFGNKALSLKQSSEDAPQESGISWWYFIIILIVPAGLSALHGLNAKIKSK